MRHWKDSRRFAEPSGGGSMAPTVWICDLPSSQGFGVASAEENWGVYLFGLTSDVSEYFVNSR
eukprot:scaffold22318_cov62-Cyclotella_meneghiniana.AAC.2